MMSRLGQFTDVRCALVVGGLSLNAQATELRSYPEVVVATPVSVVSLDLSLLFGVDREAEELPRGGDGHADECFFITFSVVLSDEVGRFFPLVFCLLYGDDREAVELS